jgi:hypothetical protein
MIDILTLLSDALTHHPSRPAVVDRHGAMSFKTLAHEAGMVRAGLASRGMRLGQTVVLRAGQSRFFAPALLGAWQAGARVAILHPAWPDIVADDLTAQCGAAAVISIGSEPTRSDAGLCIASCESAGAVLEGRAAPERAGRSVPSGRDRCHRASTTCACAAVSFAHRSVGGGLCGRVCINGAATKLPFRRGKSLPWFASPLSSSVGRRHCARLRHGRVRTCSARGRA